MNYRSKIFILTCNLIILTGFGLLWYGLKLNANTVSQPQTQVFLQAASSAVVGIEGQKTLVIKVVDGDTIEIESGQKVRLIGVDTPETVDPRRPVGCFGQEASNETKSLISGKRVILQKDISNTDKYDRMLRYVFLPLENGQTLFVNDYLIREGFGLTLAYPPDVKYSEQFRQAENEAKEAKRGLWGKCDKLE